MSRAINRILGALALSAMIGASSAHAQKAYGPGVSDSEIKLGQSTPLSGPASAFGAGAGRAVVGYFEMLNEQGGINGRKINFTQLDNAYSAPKAIEQSRKLVEDVGVLAEVGTIGTVPNVAIQKFLNSRQVPQLFITAGGRRFNDPKTFPWTVPLYPDFETEGRVVAKYILKTKPDAKIGVLYQNDDYGKDYIKGLEAGLGAKASNIVDKEPFEVTAPSVASQIVKLRGSGATIFVILATPTKTIQAYATANALKFSPDVIYTNSVSATDTFLTLAKANGGGDLVNRTFTTQYAKDPANPKWDNDAAMKLYKQVMAKYYPKGRVTDGLNLYGVATAEAFVELLYGAGKNPTRASLMKAFRTWNQANPFLLPGVKQRNNATNQFPIKCEQLVKFTDGTFKPVSSTKCSTSGT